MCCVHCRDLQSPLTCRSGAPVSTDRASRPPITAPPSQIQGALGCFALDPVYPPPSLAGSSPPSSWDPPPLPNLDVLAVRRNPRLGPCPASLPWCLSFGDPIQLLNMHRRVLNSLFPSPESQTYIQLPCQHLHLPLHCLDIITCSPRYPLLPRAMESGEDRH